MHNCYLFLFALSFPGAVFSPLAILLLLDQFHRLPVLYHQLLCTGLLIVCLYCVFASTLCKVDKNIKKAHIQTRPSARARTKLGRDLVIIYDLAQTATHQFLAGAILRVGMKRILGAGVALMLL